MPLKIYCPNVNCAEPILYELTKPIVCPFCSQSLTNNNIASQKSKPIKREIIEDFDDLDDGESLPDPEENEQKTHKLFGQTSKKSRKNRHLEDDENNINIDDLNINALQLDVPISTKKEKGVTLGQVIKEQKTGFEREKPKKVNKKKELEEFRLSAGLGGRKDISIEAPEDKE